MQIFQLKFQKNEKQSDKPGEKENIDPLNEKPAEQPPKKKRKQVCGTVKEKSALYQKSAEKPKKTRKLLFQVCAIALGVVIQSDVTEHT